VSWVLARNPWPATAQSRQRQNRRGARTFGERAPAIASSLDRECAYAIGIADRALGCTLPYPKVRHILSTMRARRILSLVLAVSLLVAGVCGASMSFAMQAMAMRATTDSTSCQTCGDDEIPAVDSGCVWHCTFSVQGIVPVFEFLMPRQHASFSLDLAVAAQSHLAPPEPYPPRSFT
jgi:hypothetical protein